MIKNDEVKKLLISEFLVFIIVITISIITSFTIYNKALENNSLNNAYIIGAVLNQDETLESTIANSLIFKENLSKGKQFLDKYGLSEINNDDLKQSIIKTNLTITLTSLVLIAIINYLFIRNNYKKVAKIDQYMNNILNDDYSLDIKDYCEGDISNLKNDTYKMTIKLKEQSELLEKEKKYLEEILEDISHQVKTPLTSMYMINDILANEPNKQKRQGFLNKNEQQLNRIEWLITSLLKMSRLDSGTVKLKPEKVKVKTLIDKAINPINELIEIKNIKLNLDIDNIDVLVDLNWTSEALLNIIKNACEHTTDEISIKAITNPIYTAILIKDNGKGISKTDLPHIFKRFYKGSHNKDSIGIGLNMALKIINLQNGTIAVDTSTSGTTFTIKIFKSSL